MRQFDQMDKTGRGALYRERSSIPGEQLYTGRGALPGEELYR